MAVIFYHAILMDDRPLTAILNIPIYQLSSLGDISAKLALTVLNGHTAVVIFFVLSGFVLGRSIDRVAGQPPTRTAIAFVVKRLLRIYPGLAVAILFGFLLSAGWIAARLPMWEFAPFQSAANVGLALQNALLTQITVNGATWTLQAELLAIPFIFGASFLSRRWGVGGAVAALSCAALARDVPGLVGWLPNMSVSVLPFVAGVVASDRRLSRSSTDHEGSLWLVAFLTIAAPVVAAGEFGAIAKTILAAGTVFMLDNAGVDSPMRRALASPLPVFLGRISYSLYLLNVPLLWVGFVLSSATGFSTIHYLPRGLFIGLAVTIATIPIAWLSERYVEAPCIALGRRLGRRFSPPLQPKAEPTPAA